MIGSKWKVLREVWQRFGKDESGLILIYVTIALPVVIGFSLLAIDVGRLSTLQSTLQHGADALALAAGGELDRRPDAITRAENAVTKLINTGSYGNKSLFASTVVTIDNGAVDTCYLASIPASDATPISNGDCLADTAANAAIARFLQIKVHPTTFNTIFPASFLGGANTTQTSAAAVAGLDQAICKFTPLFICNPFETTGAAEDPSNVYNDYGLYNFVKTVANRRRLLSMWSHDNQWAPGNFGYLEANGGPGNVGLAESIAGTNPPICSKLDNLSVSTNTGARTTLMKAFNVRFDLYANGSAPGGTPWTTYPPATNARKGYLVKKTTGGGAPNACNDNNPIQDLTSPVDYEKAIGFPIDSNCTPGSGCPAADGRLGNGDWGGDTAGLTNVPDFLQYWNTNFNHSGAHSAPLDSSGTPYSNTNKPSRYDIYLYENANSLAGYPSRPWTVGGRTYQEIGSPVCRSGAGVSNPDRRIIYGAVINCGAAGLAHGKTTGLKAVAFAKFFMTRPIEGNASDAVLWTEIVDVVKPGEANSVAKDMVQLYR